MKLSEARVIRRSMSYQRALLGRAWRRFVQAVVLATPLPRLYRWLNRRLEK